MKRFEYREGSSSKFWAVSVSGSKVTTTWGRIGTAGQSKTTSLASPAAAKAAADKQIAAKVGKGYVEAAAAAKQTPATQAAAPKRIPDKDLWEQGYPHLRRLAPDLKKHVAKAVRKELDAIDPEFPVDVPADVARAFLSAIVHPRQDTKARADAIAAPAPVDVALFDKVLQRLCPSLVAETYMFRIQDAAFLFEAFLGTEVVAERIVARLADVIGQPTLWSQRDNGHDHAFHWAIALGYMRLRMTPARWKATIAPLAKVKPGRLLITHLVQQLVDPKAPMRSKDETLRMYTIDLALQRGDTKPLRDYQAKWGAYWRSPRFYYVTGVELLQDFDPKALLRLPAWQQRRVVAEYGRLPGAPIKQVMATLATGRAAAKEAAAWIAEHGGTLPAAAKSGSHKPLTYAQANKIIATKLKDLEKRLLAAKGNAKQELAILADAFQTYCEARAAAGDVIPEAYFTHVVGELKWKTTDDEQFKRWMDLAIEAAS